MSINITSGFKSSITKYVIALFVLMFLVINSIIFNNLDAPIEAIDAFILDPEEPLEIHTYVLSMLSHQNIIHLFVNCIVFYSFGKYVESVYDSKILILTFVVSGLIASIGYVVVFSLGVLPVSSVTGALGASGGIAGVIGLLTVRNYKHEKGTDNNKILLFFFVPVRMHVGMSLFLILSVLAVVIGGIGFLNIAHLIHIFGLLTGVIIGYYLTYIRDMKTILPSNDYSFINNRNFALFTSEETDSIKIEYSKNGEEKTHEITDPDKETESSFFYDVSFLRYKPCDHEYKKELEDGLLEDLYSSPYLTVVTDNSKIDADIIGKINDE